MTQKILYGGQAVIEGVMVRGRRFVACAVREPKGKVIVASEALSPAIYASRWSKIPFLRAVTVLWDTLVLGTRMLMYSANIAVAEQLRDEGTGDASETKAIPAGAAFGTLAVSLAFGIGLFFILPLFLASLADPFLNTSLSNSNSASLVSNILEGLIRLGLFLAYIGGIGLLPEVRRIFQYHGAEHKTIAAEEAGAPLTPEAIQHFSKEHPRCGTGFLLVVVVVSIFVFALLGRPPILLRIASRIALIPVVAALSYELIKFGSAHRENPLLNWLVVRPSLAMQSLTTREPDDKMIEVAVAALERVKGEEASSKQRAVDSKP